MRQFIQLFEDSLVFHGVEGFGKVRHNHKSNLSTFHSSDDVISYSKQCKVYREWYFLRAFCLSSLLSISVMPVVLCEVLLKIIHIKPHRFKVGFDYPVKYAPDLFSFFVMIMPFQ